jgi:hypothetical protein
MRKKCTPLSGDSDSCDNESLWIYSRPSCDVMQPKRAATGNKFSVHCAHELKYFARREVPLCFDKGKPVARRGRKATDPVQQ